MATFKWIIENLGNIMLLVTIFLMLLGAIVESIARLIPTKTPDTALTRIGLCLGRFGKGLVLAGKFLEFLLDYIKFPNNLKK